jgi:hypothetical protein
MLNLKRLFFICLPFFLAMLLLACAEESDFSQAEAESIFGAIETPAGEIVATLFAHFENLPATNSKINFSDESQYSGLLTGSQGGEAGISGEAGYTPKEELTPATVDTSAILNFSAYVINGLILDGEIHLAYIGDRQSFTRTLKGDVIVSGKLSGALSIDMTIQDDGKKREWTGSLGSHIYDSQTSY